MKEHGHISSCLVIAHPVLVNHSSAHIHILSKGPFQCTWPCPGSRKGIPPPRSSETGGTGTAVGDALLPRLLHSANPSLQGREFSHRASCDSRLGSVLLVGLVVHPIPTLLPSSPPTGALPGRFFPSSCQSPSRGMTLDHTLMPHGPR